MDIAGNIVMIGLPGKGKSTLLNTIASGNPNSGDFPAGRSPTAFTKDIVSKVVMVQAPNEKPLPVRMFDLPGLMDGQIKVNQWSDMLKQKLTGVLIDLVFIVVSANDRVDVGNTLIAIALPFFFEEFDVFRCCLAMTHCDQEDDIPAQYVNDWCQELTKCANRAPGTLCGTLLRFDKKKAVKGELGFQGKEPHADEIRREIIGIIREQRTLTVNEKDGGEPVRTQAIIKDITKVDGKRMYGEMTNVIEPQVLKKYVPDASEAKCCSVQ